MGPNRRRQLALAMALGGLAVMSSAQSLTWQTVVNNSVTMPDSTATFNSYSQPSINAAGLVVFQGRASGTVVVHGIYGRDMAAATPPFRITSMGSTVPQPNNTMYNGALASFNSFPSLPRIDIGSPLVAVRGQSLPVYTYMLPDGTETRVGTSGVYANPGGVLTTGASLLGAAATAGVITFPYFSVPGAPAGTRFDQFPGSAAVTNATIITYKGNYTDPSDSLGKTGVFYRDVVANGGTSATYVIASSSTVIPIQPAGGTVKFGSTAPPSAANGYMTFVGSDIEDAPTLGGVYRAPLQQPPVLETLVSIGEQVPGEPVGVGFAKFGEGLSISADGTRISFWATWGTDTFPRTLFCPTDGQAALIAYCLTQHPSGYTVDIPVQQGIFVVDTVSGLIHKVARTGREGITDFLYWVYSGAPPGVGSADPSMEPPRWRSSAFSALSGNASTIFQTAFKARRNGVDGIYVRNDALSGLPLITVAEQLGSGTAIDPQAPANSLITAIGIERDGFRNGRLAITASMLYETTVESLGWGGIYLTQVPFARVKAKARDFNGDGRTDIVWRNTASGETTLWLMDGTVPASGAALFGDGSWSVTHDGDFNGNAKSDLLWRNAGTGQTAIWLMNGLTPSTKAMTFTSLTWAVSHRGDMDGNGTDDLLWRNSVTGETAIWLMDGTAPISSAIVLGNANWAVTHSGDFNGDGRNDLLWSNSVTGEAAIWLMNGTAGIGGAVLSTNPGWKVTGIGDFNGDGRDDLLWNKSATGETAVWLMDGTAQLGGAIVLASANWSVTHIADFNGDGRDDLLWRNAASGETAIWLMNGLTASSGAVIFADPLWRATTVGDFDGDGRSDIAWTNTATGAKAAWLMNGLTATSSAILLVNPAWTMLP